MPARPRHRLAALSAVVYVLTVSVSWLWAHDSPEHVVTLLSEKMQQSGVTAELLHQRAVEYKALGNFKAAMADLQRARQLQPDNLPILQELARVQQAAGQFDASLKTVQEAIALGHAAAPAELWMVRAEIQLDKGAAQDALQSCAHAFTAPNPNLDWYLVRSRAQAMLKLHEARIRDLKEGWEQLGSSVLKLEWIDAMNEGGQFAHALREIEPELESSRWRSTWLLRRAQSRLGLGKRAEARQDLRVVIDEISQRLNPLQPDVTLLADRGCAYVLLGNAAAARQDLQTALKAGADDWVVRPLKRFLQNEN